MQRNRVPFNFSNDYTLDLPGYDLKVILRDTQYRVERIVTHNLVVMGTQKKYTLQAIKRSFLNESNKILTAPNVSPELVAFLIKLGHIICTISSPHLDYFLYIFCQAKLINFLSSLEDNDPIEDIVKKIDEEWWYILEAMINLYYFASAELLNGAELSMGPPKIVRAIHDFKIAKTQVYYQALKLINKLYSDRHTQIEDYQLLADILKKSADYFVTPALIKIPIFKTELRAAIENMEGKIRHWKTFCQGLGACLMIMGAIAIGLGIASVPVSLGTSAVGVKIGYSMAVVGGTLLGFSIFKYGREKSSAFNSAMGHFKEQGEKCVGARSREEQQLLPSRGRC